MLIKDKNLCKEIIARDGTRLKELLSPLQDKVDIGYSLALAKVLMGETSLDHQLKSSEVYYILQGEGKMYLNDKVEKVSSGQLIYIPPHAQQKIKNTGSRDLIFLCIVDPPWRADEETVCESGPI
jgi:mannose-6-phosphate isomerase-like protein (cupin superfamily)